MKEWRAVTASLIYLALVCLTLWAIGSCSPPPTAPANKCLSAVAEKEFVWKTLKHDKNCAVAKSRCKGEADFKVVILRCRDESP